MSQIEREFQDYDTRNVWPNVFQKIKHEASLNSIQEQHSVGEARKPENRTKNRYRDVSPYDHSRVILQKGHSDYINASMVEVPECNRRYILSQGPLEHTAADFWQMVWEQNTKAVIMLNRIIEKGTRKCHQYWPLGEDYDEEVMVFDDVGLRVRLLEQQQSQHYIVRSIEILDIETEETRIVFHFHYITWPDFGVPSSPLEFLDFLEVVRAQGVLEKDVGPAVIHCSAGIGRSGTFCLVDTALILVEKYHSMDINIASQLLSMRSFRMGLIQTPEQLRFSYQAIIAGAHMILQGDEPDEDHEEGVSGAGAQSVTEVLETYMDMTGAESRKDVPPPPPCRTTSLSPRKRPPSPPPRRTQTLSPTEEPEKKLAKSDPSDVPPKPARAFGTVEESQKNAASGSGLDSEIGNDQHNSVGSVKTRTITSDDTTVGNTESLIKDSKVVSKETIEVVKTGETSVQGTNDYDGAGNARRSDVLDNEPFTKGADSVSYKERMSENNNPAVDKSRNEAGVTARDNEGDEDDDDFDSDELSVDGEEAVAGAEGGVHLQQENSTIEPHVRRRIREERKKKTQELIKSMKDKQRQSETWKKRKTYFRPIAIGLSILIGGYLLYKFCW